MKKTRIILLILFLAIIQSAEAQDVTNIRKQNLIILTDTVFIESLILIPNSEIISLENELLDNSKYEIVKREDLAKYIQNA